jgi:hypothetical protein
MSLRRAALCALLAASVLLEASCGGSSHVRSPAEVERTLRAAGLDLHRTSITVTLESVDGGQPNTPPIQDVIATPTASSGPVPTFSVDGGRAIVYVYESEQAAAPYAAMPRGHVLLARNVVAVWVRGTLSRRLREAFARLD